MTIAIDARRAAYRLALLGVQIRSSLPFYLRADPRSFLLSSEDAEKVAAIAQQAVIEAEEQKAFLKEFRTKAIRYALITDAIVGAIVAGIAKFNADDQFVIIIGWLAAIQLALTIYAYHQIKKVFRDLLSEFGVPGHLHGEILRAALAGFRSILWLVYPIRIVEFFVFVALFLVLYSLNVSDIGSLGPVEQVSRLVFDFVATVSYGANQTPQDRLVMTILGFGLSTIGSWIIEKWFAMQINLQQ